MANEMTELEKNLKNSFREELTRRAEERALDILKSVAAPELPENCTDAGRVFDAFIEEYAQKLAAKINENPFGFLPGEIEV